MLSMYNVMHNYNYVYTMHINIKSFNILCIREKRNIL